MPVLNEVVNCSFQMSTANTQGKKKSVARYAMPLSYHEFLNTVWL